MRPKLLIALFAAAAFLCALFGAVGEASAAQLDEGASAASMGMGEETASPAPVRANVPPPNTYAAKFGAPLCDDRGASAYAAEPKPAPVDGGEVAAAGAGSTSEACQTTSGSLFKRTTDANPTQGDDLNRTPPVARDLAILPPSVAVPDVVMVLVLDLDSAADGAREGFEPRDNPPPRPIPWRS